MKAVAVLANPTQAVELLAAFAALRSRSLDVALDTQLSSMRRRALWTRQPSRLSRTRWNGRCASRESLSSFLCKGSVGVHRWGSIRSG